MTNFTPEEIQRLKSEIESGNMHPRDAKMLLAKTIVEMYHGEKAADRAEQHFISVFQQKSMPDEIPVVEWKGAEKVSVIDLIVELKLLTSKSEARRMIANSGVKINGEKIENTNLLLSVENGLVVQVGKRKFVKIKR